MNLSVRRIALAATLLLAALALTGCGKDAPAAGPAESDQDHGEAGHTDGEDDHDAPESTTIAAAMAEQAGIRVAPVAAGTIADEHDVQGLLTPVDGRVAQVMARFPGPIRSLRANVGDNVRAGQVLASIESNLSLTTYTVSAPIAGVVLARQAQVGGALAGQRQAHQATAVGDHEVDVRRLDQLGGHDQVAFVLTVFVIDDDDHAAEADVLEDLGDGGEVHALAPCCGPWAGTAMSRST